MDVNKCNNIHIQYANDVLQPILTVLDPIPSVHYFFPSFSPPDMLCNPTDLICEEGAPFETMIYRTDFTDGLLAWVFGAFPQL